MSSTFGASAIADENIESEMLVTEHDSILRLLEPRALMRENQFVANSGKVNRLRENWIRLGTFSHLYVFHKASCQCSDVKCVVFHAVRSCRLKDCQSR